MAILHVDMNLMFPNDDVLFLKLSMAMAKILGEKTSQDIRNL